MDEAFPEFREVLDEKFQGLLAQAVTQEEGDRPGLTQLLTALDEFLCSASHLFPEDAPTLRVVVGRLQKGLGGGRPWAAVHERILKTLAEVRVRIGRLDETPAVPGKGASQGAGKVTGAIAVPSTALPPETAPQAPLPKVAATPVPAPAPTLPAPVKAGGNAPPPVAPASPVLREAEGRKAVDEDTREGFEDLLQEGPEHLRRLEEVFTHWDRGENADALEGYRAFHTLKGIFGFLEMSGCSTLAHRAEECLEPFKQGGRPGAATVELLWKVREFFASQLERIREGLPKGSVALSDPEGLLKRLEAPRAETAPEPFPTENAGTPVPPTPVEDPDYLRVPVRRVEELLETVGDLARLHAEISTWVSPASPEAEGLERLGRSLARAQEDVLRMRLVPVKNLFLRMERASRDLARRMGKDVEIRLEGLETEFDKHLVEELQEPLLHLVRNALDHGLEAPDVRKQANKAPRGRLTLRALSRAGGVTIQVEDDGRGLALAPLAEKARALGWWKESGLPPKDVAYEWIFKPGFSTAKALTEVSGRGVGLDVVARRVADLKGALRVDSTPGRGACFTLRLPLTLAVVDVVLLRFGRHRLAFPSDRVVGFSEGREVQARKVGERLEWAEKNGAALRRLDLSGALGVPPPRPGKGVAVELETGEGRSSILADEVLGRHRLMLRKLRGVTTTLHGVSGGVLLPDGSVGFLLDPERLTA